MRIKRFKAKDMTAAMQLVKNDLGPDAVILTTRQLKGDESGVEITAGAHVGGPKSEPAPAVGKPNRPAAVRLIEANDSAWPPSGRGTYSRPRPDGDLDADHPPKPTPRSSPPPPDPRIDGLSDDLAEVRELILDLTHRSNLTDRLRTRPEMLRLYRRLVDGEVDPTLARTLVERVAESINGGEADPLKVLHHKLTAGLKTTAVELNQPDQGPRHVALLGPSGVGKTTTLAKLAALWAVKGKKQVGLISLDTYRLGAAEQLRTYARIMGLPIQVAQDRDEFVEAVELFENCQLVLIDTAGRSLKNDESLSDLTDTLSLAHNVSQHLVVSAGLKDRDIARTINRVGRSRTDSLIISKIDETQEYGNVINNLIKYKVPVSFITNGQKVPDDIRPATPGQLARLITGATKSFSG
jgi:flagellar biosynthesis protein FlhF